MTKPNNQSFKEIADARGIPDYFVYGTRTAASLFEWEELRKEFKARFLSYMYGELPTRLTPSVEIKPGPIDFAGKGYWESVYLTLENNGLSHTVKTDLILPRDKTNVPVFLYISFAREIPNKYLPVEEILDNGFGIYTFCYEDVSSDNGDFSNGIAPLFDTGCGKISLWAYMASICMDYLKTRDEVNFNAVAVVGHSRLGKTALLASALDERFLLTCSNNSGCCGAAPSRSKPPHSETLNDILNTFPFWFTKRLDEYRKEPEKLPFDQHMLLSLIAPRYLMIGAAEMDAWADNDGQLLSCKLASQAWEFYGKRGFVYDKALLDTPFALLDGEVCFHQRRGTHFLSRDDWHIYMKKFKEILEK